MRLLACLAIAIACMDGAVFAQATPNVPVSATTNTPPEADEKAWSFSASAYTYFVPDDRDYVQPTFTADRGWLHLEARYNYEALDTGSAWVGYNFSGGETLAWELTPMLGGVFGDTTGIAPGYKGSLGWRKLELYSEGEYVFDTGSSSDSFFYNWSELTLAPVEWFRFGMVTQRTRVYQTDRDIQRGVLAGFSFKKREPDRLCPQSGRGQAHFCARGRTDFLNHPRQISSCAARPWAFEVASYLPPRKARTLAQLTYRSRIKRRRAIDALSSYAPFDERFGSFTFFSGSFLYGITDSRCAIVFRRAARLSSDRTMYHGAKRVSVFLSMASRARE